MKLVSPFGKVASLNKTLRGIWVEVKKDYPSMTRLVKIHYIQDIYKIVHFH